MFWSLIDRKILYHISTSTFNLTPNLIFFKFKSDILEKRIVILSKHAYHWSILGLSLRLSISCRENCEICSKCSSLMNDTSVSKYYCLWIIQLLYTPENYRNRELFHCTICIDYAMVYRGKDICYSVN